MELVEVNCPRSLDLINSNNNDSIDKNNIKSIRQTIDIYDTISIFQEIKKNTGIVINSSNSNEINEIVKEIITIFEQYVGIKIENLIININKNTNQSFNHNENIYSGLIIALNNYFKCNLNIRELMYLTKSINYLIPYYLMGGYKKILKDGKIKKLENNCYKKYFILDSKTISKEELEYIKVFFESYPNIDYLNNTDNSFIAVKDGVSTIPILHIKKEIPEMRLNQCQNSSGNKILIKYLK